VRIAAPSGDVSSFRSVARLVDAMRSGDVEVLIVHGVDPVHTLPAKAGFVEALESVKLVVSTASMPDETTAKATLILPDHTAMESWGDAAPRAGVRSLVQPTLRPLFDTRAFGDTLLDTARAMGKGGDLPDGSFRSVV
jgi:anaerobic selenocysteine-containing dehydrogenase